MKTVSTIVLIIVLVLALIYLIFGNESSTFTANIDGSEFKADRGGASYRSGRLNISAFLVAPDTTVVIIDLNATKVGTYLLNGDNPETENVAAYYVGRNVFASTSTVTGSVTITKLDLEEKEVSGTFVFRAVQVVPPGPKIVNVSNGAFEDFPIEVH